jgi:solute carrier family 13 (sodium-dependent dicarboxylate transporter), member 2/3/5
MATLLVTLGPVWWPIAQGGDFPLSCDPSKVRLGLSIFSAVAVLWITEALPINLTALLIPLMAGAWKAVPVAKMLPPFADPLLFLFLGGFSLATAVSVHGVDVWCSRRILHWSGGRFMPSAYLIFAVTAGVSMWISNTATTAMILPLCLGVLGSMDHHPDRARHRIFLLLGVAYAASIGGLGTIVGSPPNGIVAKELHLSFGRWLSFGLVAVAVLMPAMVLTLKWAIRPVDARCEIETEYGVLQKSSRPVLMVFVLIAVLWSLGGWIGPWLGLSAGYDTLVSLLAVALLVGGKMITWEQFEQGTPWGVLLLFGGGLALGEILKETGASLYLANRIAGMVDGLPLAVMVGSVVLFTIFFTELASNTAVAALMVPVFASAADAMGVSAPALLIPLGLAASCAFMLPVATGPNALVHATGMVPQREMVRAGFYLNLVCTTLLTAIALCWL